jgi:hypothetical protein
MLTRPTDFVALFLSEGNDDEPYWMPGRPASAQTLAEVTGWIQDDLGFEAYREHFQRLAEVIEVCTAEALADRGSGVAATKTIAHPSVLKLAELTGEQQAGISAAALQGLAWFEKCLPLKRDTFLRNQVALRVLVAVLMVIGVKARGYSPAQLAAIAALAAPMRGTGHFDLHAHDAVVKLLAANVKQLPRNETTRADVRMLLDRPQYGAPPQWLVKAQQKLHAHLGL